MRRVLLIAVAAILVGAAVAWLNRESLLELARHETRRELERLLGQPIAIESLEVEAFPPRVKAAGISIGKDQFASVDALDVRLASLSSLAEARAVIQMTAHGVFVDTTRLPKSDEADAEELSIPAFRLGGLNVESLRVRFRMGDEVAMLSVGTTRAHVESARLRDLVAGTLALKDAQLSRAGRVLDLGDIEASAVRDFSGITVQSASLKAPGRNVELSGTSATLHRVEGNLDLHDLVIIDDGFDHFTGKGHASGELRGPLSRPLIVGTIEIDDVHAVGRLLGTLTAEVRHEGDTTRFEKARLQGNAGEVRGDVVAKFRREIPIEGTLSWDVTDIEALLDKLDLQLGFDNQLKATTAVKGHFDPLRLEVELDGTVLAAAAVGDVRANATITKDETEVTFSLAQAERTTVAGKVDARHGVLDGRVDLDTSDLAAVSMMLPQAVKTLDLGGAASGTATIGGTSSAPRFRGSVFAGPLSVADVLLDRLEGEFEWTESALVLPSALLAIDGGLAALNGKIALQEHVSNDWRLDLTNVDTDLAVGIARRFFEFPHTLEGGHLTGSVTCAGRWSAPVLTASLLADAPRVAGEDFARVELSGEHGGKDWSFRLNATHTSDLQFQLSGRGQGDTASEILVSTARIDLAQVHAVQPWGVAGELELDGRLSGRLAAPDGRLTLRVDDLSVGEFAIGDLDVVAMGEKGRWRVDGDVAERHLSVAASAETKAPFAYTARFDWQDFTFAYQAGESDRLTGSTTGTADFSGALARIDQSRTSIHVAELNLQWGDALVGLMTPILANGDTNRLDIQPFSIAGKDTSLHVSGTVTQRADLAVAVQGRASLDYLELLGEPFVSTAGAVVVDMRVQFNRWRGWQTAGRATLERAVLDFGLPIAFTDTNAEVVANGRAFEIESLTASSGGGRLAATGVLTLDDGSALTWQLADVGVNPEPGIEGVISGKGTVDGSWRELTVRGNVELKSGLYARDFEIVDIPALFRPRIEAVAPAPPQTVVRLDLETAARGGIFVDNNVAQVELALDGRIRGTVREPRISGSVSVIGGTVKVRRRTFTLTGGAADFRGNVPPNPTLNINAETEITTRDADYLIAATVTGTARDPVVTFTSDDPSLTHNDIVSLVAVGRTAAELQGEEGGVSSLDALALVPTAPVEEQVTQLVGIDRFEIDLAQTNSQGEVSPGFTIGKNLTDRFRAALTTTFDVDARNAVLLEYDLTRRISLIGQWEAETDAEAGAFGGGVRMRYEFRRIPFSLLTRPLRRDAPAAE